MDPTELDGHAFIIRIWREGNGRATWRGTITHVPSEEQHHLNDLRQIAAYILPYLMQLDVSLTPYWRLRWWLQHIGIS